MENGNFLLRNVRYDTHDAYSDLEQYGKVISEEKHVRDLLQGI